MLWNVDYFFYRLKYIYGRYLFLKKPIDVSLELASTCNMACSYCYHSDKESLPFKQGLMSWPIAKQIIDDAFELGVNSLKFNWKGEPTLNRNFRSITNYAETLAEKSVFIDRVVNSNFKFEQATDTYRGLAACTKVKVSYDSFRKEVFEKQRTLGDWELTTSNIDKFYNWPKRKTKLVIQAVRTNLNKDEDFESESKKRWPSAELSVRDMVHGRVDNEATSLLGFRTRDLSRRKSCLQAHVRLIFNYKGDAFMCCPDIGEKLKIGNIMGDTMESIFNGDKAKEMRRSLIDKRAFLKDPCRNCPSYESYAGFSPKFDS